MLDTSTFYLIVAMAGFVLVAVIMIHHHNCSDIMHRKERELVSITNQLSPRIDILEREVIDLKVELDEIQEKIDTFKASKAS